MTMETAANTPAMATSIDIPQSLAAEAWNWKRRTINYFARRAGVRNTYTRKPRYIAALVDTRSPLAGPASFLPS